MRKSIALIGTILAAGCSLAPNYERPAAPVAANWADADASGTRAAASTSASTRNCRC
jgi:multidrug efflux system outer membrane protein